MPIWTIPDEPPPLPGKNRGTPGAAGGGAAASSSSTSTDNTAFTAADSAVVCPILWGTGKVTPTMIEMLPPTVVQPPAWSVNPVGLGEIWGSSGSAYECITPGNTSVAPTGSGAAPVAWAPLQTILTSGASSIRQSNGNVYRAITPGTSGPNAPAGTGTSISDGVVTWCFVCPMSITVINDGTAVWKFLQQLPCPLYYQRFVDLLCEGEIDGVLTMWWAKTQTAGSSLIFPGHVLQVYVGPDAGGQILVDPRFDASGYQHTAVVATPVTTGAPSGTQAETPDRAYEVRRTTLYGVSTPDVNPADITTEILTHSRRGFDWPGSRVDASIGGAGAASLRTWADAKGVRFSFLLDALTAGVDLIADLSNATNTIFFVGQGKMKAVPLDDTPSAAPIFGSTNYVPNNTARYNITPNDVEDGQPVSYVRTNSADRKNVFPVQFTNRANGYAQDIAASPVLTDIRTRGIYPGSTITLPFIFPNGTWPTQLSRIAAWQSLKACNQYTVVVSPRFIALEPGDIVTIPVGDSIANFAQKPVRITQIDEDSANWYTLTCVDYPAGVAAPAAFTPPPGDGLRGNFLNTAGSQPTAYQAAQQTSQQAENLWPNANSETDPPSYVVPQSGALPEWDFRTNIGSGASFTASHSGGSMVVSVMASGSILPFQVVTGSGVPAACYVLTQVSGTPGGAGTYTISTGTTVTSRSMTCIGAYAGNWVRQFVGLRQMFVSVPCAPGDRFSLSVQHRRLDGVTGNARIIVNYVDATGASTGASSATGSTSNLWQPLSVTGVPAPAGTVSAQCQIVSSATGGTLYQFDAFVFRRIVETPVIASGLVGQGLATDATGATVWAGDAGWTAVTFAGTFANFGGGYAVAAFRKDPNGYVHIKGVIAGGTSLGTIFTLPVGYRPLENHEYAQKQTVGGTSAYGETTVNSGGTVVATAYSVGGSLTIDCHFLGEQ